MPHLNAVIRFVYQCAAAISRAVSNRRDEDVAHLVGRARKAAVVNSLVLNLESFVMPPLVRQILRFSVSCIPFFYGRPWLFVSVAFVCGVQSVASNPRCLL